MEKITNFTIRMKKVTTPTLVAELENEECISESQKIFKMITDCTPSIAKNGSYNCDVSMAMTFLNKKELKLHIIIKGTFEVIDAEEEELESIARVNCGAMLYPYLREKVSALTGMAGINPYYLPSRNFIAEYNEWLDWKKRQDTE